MRKILGFLLALCATAAGLAVATPAQAWSYCSPSTPANVVYLFPGQGYCGTPHSISLAGLPFGACVNLGGGTNNMAGALYNKTSRAIIVSDSHGCVGAPSQGFPPNTSDPDLFAGVNLYQKISSISVVS